MALHFVSTSVLTSSDGIAFEHEEKKDTLDVRNAAKTNDTSRPLFEQLAEQNDKKQAERDAITKLIFAPPKALDDEEVEFYNDLEERQKQLKELRKATEEEELKHFRSAMVENTGANKSAIPATVFARHDKSEDATKPRPVIVKTKRKVPSECLGNHASSKKPTSEVGTSAPKDANTNKEAAKSSIGLVSERVSNDPAGLLGLGLGAYGSDSESESEQ